jgi:hypothetical protein
MAAAKFCAWSPLVAIVLNVWLGGRGREDLPGPQGVAFIGPGVMLLGIAFGIFALCEIPKHGRKGILAPALIGITINIACFVLAFVAFERLSEKPTC